MEVKREIEERSDKETEKIGVSVRRVYEGILEPGYESGWGTNNNNNNETRVANIYIIST